MLELAKALATRSKEIFDRYGVDNLGDYYASKELAITWC